MDTVYIDKIVPLYVLDRSPVNENAVFCSESLAIACMDDPALLDALLDCVHRFADDTENDGLLDMKKTFQTPYGGMQIWRENAGYIIMKA